LIIQAAELLKSSEAVWPDLVYLDISGKDDIDCDMLLNFISLHPKIKFLGLLKTGAAYAEIFTDSRSANHRSDIIVTGTSDVKQILEALNRQENDPNTKKLDSSNLFCSRYLYRPAFVQKCLYKLFRITTNSTEPQVEFLKVCLDTFFF
jgi:hypothetical protein